MAIARVTKFRCKVCGKLTAGSLPRDGDGTARFARRHTRDGETCPGVHEHADWVDIDDTE